MSGEPGEEAVTLAFIGQSVRALVNEVASLRDDMNVLAAIVRRMDNSQTRILEGPRHAHAATALSRPLASVGGAHRALTTCGWWARAARV